MQPSNCYAAAAVLVGAMIAMSSFGPGGAQVAGALPTTVQFPSADGKTTLTGFVYTPKDRRAGRAPAVVMMHGRAGPYSTNVKGSGPYNASTLSKRHKMWGERWSALGYVAVLVDSFAPRGFPGGFAQGTINERPDAVNEVTVRPLDAYGALAWLRTRADVVADRIGLQGWSNGGSAALATMASDAPGITEHTPVAGFRAALALYPACGLHGRYKDGLKAYAPLRVFHGAADEEVSSKRCAALVEKSRALGGLIDITLYPDATHDFDDPGRRRQSVEANVRAKADVLARAP